MAPNVTAFSTTTVLSEEYNFIAGSEGANLVRNFKVASWPSVKPVHNDHPRDLKFGIVDNRWSLLTGGRCSGVGVFYEESNWDSKLVSPGGKWSLFGGG